LGMEPDGVPPLTAYSRRRTWKGGIGREAKNPPLDRVRQVAAERQKNGAAARGIQGGCPRARTGRWCSRCGPPNARDPNAPAPPRPRKQRIPMIAAPGPAGRTRRRHPPPPPGFGRPSPRATAAFAKVRFDFSTVFGSRGGALTMARLSRTRRCLGIQLSHRH